MCGEIILLMEVFRIRSNLTLIKNHLGMHGWPNNLLDRYIGLFCISKENDIKEANVLV